MTNLSLSQFDWIWWMFLFLLCLYIEKWYYIFVWKLRSKMWRTSRKCVFYSIFKNTTKPVKIFSNAFFGVQPNTWKYFLSQKISSSKNILHSENVLHRATHSLTFLLFHCKIFYKKIFSTLYCVCFVIKLANNNLPFRVYCESFVKIL